MRPAPVVTPQGRAGEGEPPTDPARSSWRENAGGSLPSARRNPRNRRRMTVPRAPPSSPKVSYPAPGRTSRCGRTAANPPVSPRMSRAISLRAASRRCKASICARRVAISVSSRASSHASRADVAASSRGSPGCSCAACPLHTEPAPNHFSPLPAGVLSRQPHYRSDMIVRRSPAVPRLPGDATDAHLYLFTRSGARTTSAAPLPDDRRRRTGRTHPG